MLKIYNTLTGKKEEFKPQDPKQVKMYTCGVTVYDDCHIGHARSLYIFDVMRRYLQYKGKREGFKLRFVRNITDIDDKIINRARQVCVQENIPLIEAFEQVRKTYIDRYYEDLKLLNIPAADVEPLATENISEMVKFIAKLIDKGIAYEVEGNVYFSVRKFSPYGRLSGKKIDDLYSSVRIENDPCKRDPFDFALWKSAKPDEPAWDSPWGKGRPGWHIECSVMSLKYLHTQTLDIHGGGRDLVFPHHENEIAQAEALGGNTFSNYWVHHGLITINGQKMAKSLGNFITIKDFVQKKQYSVDMLKIFFLQAHYSSPVDFSWERMDEVKKSYERIVILMEKIEKKVNADSMLNKRIEDIDHIEKRFFMAMDDDFNMPQALAVLFELVSMTNKKIDDLEFIYNARNMLDKLLMIFGISFFHKKQSFKGLMRGLVEKLIDTQGSDIVIVSGEEIEAGIAARNQARKNKDFELADKIRKGLDQKGIILEDTKEGTIWRRKI